MSLSDCEKCWDTPCTCGWEYRNYSEERVVEFIDSILKYHDKERILKKILATNFAFKDLAQPDFNKSFTKEDLKE